MDPASLAAPIQAARDNKVSRTWAWDVVPEKIVPASFYGYFLSMAHFFAYHALPLGRKRLGAHAKRKQWRRAIESMLRNTPDTDLKKWVESYKRLLDGDSEMLIHGEHDPLHGGRTTTVATRAPINLRRNSKDFAKGKDYAESVSTLILSQAHIKTECHTNRDVAATKRKIKTKKGVVPAATITLEHLYEGEREIGHSMKSTQTSVLNGIEVGCQEADIDSSNEGTGIQELKFQHYEIDTPILDLLCGPTLYELVDRDKFMETIMTHLDSRVQVYSVGVQQSDGTTTIQTKAQLASVLWTISVGASPITHLRLRQLCEYRLTHWVIANSAAFPELLSTPTMFTCILLCDTAV